MTTIRRDIPTRFSLPRRINRLGQLAYNLWWVWNPEGQRLFSNIDRTLWDKVNHNPVAFLAKVDRAVLNAMANTAAYVEQYDSAIAKFDQYMKADGTWFQQNHPELKNKLQAYFSFEFGLHESLPVYAGGLGILAGDHLKEASDMGLPLVGLGFIYREGYFVQHITEDGWQETRNYYHNFDEMPIIPVLDEHDKPLLISIDLPGRHVFARIWEVRVGRISLFLLDSNVPDNTEADRQLTARLYSNDLEVRISQEILLGMGGARALYALGLAPDAWHMNEGHAAFLALERTLTFQREGMKLEDAMAKVRATNVFTTHTPVPAGNDQFPLWLVEKYMSQTWAEMGLTRDQFIDLGRQATPWGDNFVMPVLALKLSAGANGVSELHGQVSRRMWNFLWPDRRESDVPITHITNGVHVSSILARRMGLLFNHYLGEDWREHADDPDTWNKIDNIPDAEIWAIRQHLKRKLVNFAKERARFAWVNGNAAPSQVVASGVMLEAYSLTIGFARRFATYKRGNLILRDFDRLMRIINNSHMPVQIVFAGKAHPADEPGKMIIQQVYRAVKDSRCGGRLVFLEDYDINMARYLVQGVDVWMNTPRRPNEASGTSGMKAAMNGVLNFSVLDGWWREGFNGHNGWAIGEDAEISDTNKQDALDAESMYDTLENEIIPLYYENRAADNTPVDWVARMKESIRTLAPQFCTRRMLKEYTATFYAPALSAEVKKNGKKAGK